jgi:hypothetical protein
MESRITLDAPSGFESYAWQDGSTELSFEAFEIGSYFLVAVDANGCLSSDTLQITGFYPAADVGLNDTVVCPGVAILLLTNQEFVFLQMERWFHNTFSGN